MNLKTKQQGVATTTYDIWLPRSGLDILHHDRLFNCLRLVPVVQEFFPGVFGLPFISYRRNRMEEPDGWFKIQVSANDDAAYFQTILEDSKTLRRPGIAFPCERY